MDALKTTFVLAVLTLAAVNGVKPADAAGTRPEKKPMASSVQVPVLVPAVTVKIGDAMLEEYHSSNPGQRTVILRQGDSAKKPSGPSTRNTLHS